MKYLDGRVYAGNFFDTGGSMTMGAVALGRVESALVAAKNDALAARGRAIASADSRVAAARAVGTSPEWQRGFDIGTIVSKGNSASGPGQDAVLASLTTVPAKSGFLAARAQQYALTREGGGALTQGGNVQASDSDDGPAIPRVALVAGGIVGVLALGYVAYTLTR